MRASFAACAAGQTPCAPAGPGERGGPAASGAALRTPARSTSPLQYLLGEWDFLDFTVEVGPGVLIPRLDTECVAETAMAALRRRAAEPGCVCAPAALDLCAGTGVLAIAMARSVPAAQVTGG